MLLLLFIIAPLNQLFANEVTATQHQLLIDIIKNNKRLITVGDRGHILYSDDLGMRWNAATTPTQVLLTAATFKGAHGWAVGHDGVILQSDDRGLHWRQQHHTPYPEDATAADIDQHPYAGMPLLDIEFVDARRGFAVGAYGFLLGTDDGGARWVDMAMRLDNAEGFHLNAIAATNTAADTVLFIVGEGGLIARSKDAGASWQRLDSPFEASLFGIELALYPHKIVCYGIAGQIAVSRDQGDHWEPVTLTAEASNHERVQEGLFASTVIASGELLIVGNDGLVIRLNPDTLESHLQYQSERASLSGVIELEQRIFVVGKGGVDEYHANP